jgi:signal peptidase I
MADTQAKPRRSFTKELWFLGLVALALALLLKTFLIQAFFIPSGSMEQTLHGCPGCVGDRVLVNKLVYKFRDIHRGEIVVFNGKNTNFEPEGSVPPAKNLIQKALRGVQGAIGFGAPGDKDFIKRVIGVPGDVVACCVNEHVTVNGAELIEPYVYMSDPTAHQYEFGPVTVPPHQLFVMGDHRDGSSDSRFNDAIPEKAVVGRAFAVFWPIYSKDVKGRWYKRLFRRIKTLPVPHTFDPAGSGPSALGSSAAAPPVLGFALAVPLTVLRRRRILRRA